MRGMRLPSHTRLFLLAALGVGACLVGVELMITAVALPRILADMADWTALRHASWIVNGYLLASIAVMPLAGRLGDRFGVPGPFAASLSLFAVGSALAGAAQDLDQLIAARVLQGIGGGAVIPLATAGAGELFEGHARARALGVVGALTFLGMAAGPFLGAAVLDTMELSGALAARGLSGSLLAAIAAPAWRWIFYLSVPLAILAGLYSWAASTGWRRERRRVRFDLVGAFLSTLALAAILVALTLIGSGSSDSGGSAATPVSLPLAVVAVVAAVLAVLHMRRHPEPFLDPRLFRDRVVAGAILLSLLTGYALATAIVGGAVFVDRVRYGGPDEQRVALGALAATMALGALVSGFALRFAGAVAVTLVGLAAAAIGLAMVGRAGAQASLMDLTAGLATFGLGFGLTVTPRSAVAVEALGRKAVGLASAAVTVARMVGMTIGLAVLTAIGVNRIQALSLVLTDAAARDAVLPPELKGRPLQDGQVVEVLERWASDQAGAILATLFLIAAGIIILAVLPALAMGGRRRGATSHAREGSERDEDPRTAVAL